MLKKHFVLFFLLIFIFGCSMSGNNSSDNSNTRSSSGQVKFQFSEKTIQSIVQKSTSIWDAYKAQVVTTDATAILVSIADSSGTTIIDMKKLNLYNMNGSFISDPLPLNEGQYQLTQFMVINASNTVIYATPVIGSALAYLVTKPLPVTFCIHKDVITKLCPEVIDTTQNTAKDFGYVTFTFNVTDTFSFLVTVFIPAANDFELTSANISIKSPTETLYMGTLDAKTNQITIKDVSTDYAVTITKDGYQDYTALFTNSRLKAYITSPLTVNLIKSTGNNPVFTEYQRIPTNGAYSWKGFSIGGNTYLAVANYYGSDSCIYSWNGSRFIQIQAIPTNAAADCEVFTIGGDTYLAVANNFNGSSYSIDSCIYRWNGSQFIQIQAIPTNAAYDCGAFAIGGDNFLAITNTFNGSTWNINSTIYRWNGNQFIAYQDIPTSNALDTKVFSIGSDSFLAVANAFNGSSNNIDSDIYRWNGSQFIKIQSIPTNGAFDWEAFTIGSDTYLAVANVANSDSIIYRWNGSQFVRFQDIPTNGATDWEAFSIGSDKFLVVANSNNNDSIIYKLEWK
jgi:hypothetical protein